VVSVDAAGRMTVRELLWNSPPLSAPSMRWGASQTVSLR
jgi:hypothetical protein